MEEWVVHFGRVVYKMPKWFLENERLEGVGVSWFPRTKNWAVSGKGVVHPREMTQEQYLRAIDLKRTAELLGLF